MAKPEQIVQGRPSAHLFSETKHAFYSAAKCIFPMLPLVSLWSCDASAIQKKDFVYTGPPASTNASASKATTLPFCEFHDDSLEYRTPDGGVVIVLDLIKSNETKVGFGCKDEYAMVLTTRNLYFVYGENTKRAAGSSPMTSYSAINVSSIMPNFVAWTQSESSASILTNDKLKNEKKSTTIYAPPLKRDMRIHTLGFDVTGAKMAYYSNRVFIATPGKVLASLQPETDALSVFHFSSNMNNPAFLVSGNKLRYGTTSSPEISITVGSDLSVTATDKGVKLR